MPSHESDESRLMIVLDGMPLHMLAAEQLAFRVSVQQKDSRMEFLLTVPRGYFDCTNVISTV